jgi:hypothetical protein
MTARRLHVLVLEGTDGAADSAVDTLTAAGHVVSRCQAAGGAQGGCNALAAGQPCPLDSTTVDLVLAVRAGGPGRTPFGGATACAHRHHAPLFVARDITQ